MTPEQLNHLAYELIKDREPPNVTQRVTDYYASLLFYEVAEAIREVARRWEA